MSPRTRYLGGMALLVLAGGAVRGFVLLRDGLPVVDSDEAIVGLMARHIVEGRAAPLYYYGQDYLGALEAWCAAAVFALVGPSALALRLVPGIFSLACIPLVRELGARCFSPRVGWVAAALFALAPSGLAVWSLKARGGFIELVAIGTAALLLAESVLFRGTGRLAVFGLGCLLGLGWWVNQQILYYAAPILVLAAWPHRSERLLRDALPALAGGALLSAAALTITRPEDFAARSALAGAILLVLATLSAILFRAGSGAVAWLPAPIALLAGVADDLPLLGDREAIERGVTGIAVVVASALAARAGTGRSFLIVATMAAGCAAFSWWNPSAPLYAGLALLAGAAGALPLIARIPALPAALAGLALGALPVWAALLSRGERLFGVVRASDPLEAPAHLAGFFSVSLPMLVGARPFWGETDFLPGLSLVAVGLYLLGLPVLARWNDRGRAALVGLFLAGVPMIFSASAFGWFREEPRYLLPIYSALFFLPALRAEHWIRRGRRALAATFLATLVSVHLYGVAHTSRSGELLKLTAVERVAADHGALDRFLLEAGIEHLYTDYWIGYRLAFETGERVIFTPWRQPATERIPEWGRTVRRSDRVAWVLPASVGQRASETLRSLGVGHHLAHASGYAVLHELERPDPVSCATLSPDELSLRGSHAASELSLAVDGDRDTRWGTHSPQEPGMWIAARLQTPGRLCWLSLVVGDFVTDFPRGLRIEVESPQGTWQTLADSQTTPGLPEWLAGGRLDLDLAGRLVRSVRLEQTGSDEVFDWSIAELRLWTARDDANRREDVP